MMIYIASRFSAQADLRELRKQLHLAGYDVQSRWLDRDEENALPNREASLDSIADEAREWAVEDLEDLSASSVVVLVLPAGRRGGCYVEYGIALAHGKRTIVVGDRTNVFTYIADEHVPHVDDVFAVLEMWRREDAA